MSLELLQYPQTVKITKSYVKNTPLVCSQNNLNEKRKIIRYGKVISV